MRCHTVAIWVAHRQVASIRNRTWRAPRMIRACYVQDPVAERGDLGAGQAALAAKADESGPGDQIGCGQDDFQPGAVGVKRMAGQVTQPGDFEFTAC